MGPLPPSGSEGVQFTLPPYMHLPGLSQAETDVADLIVAAMDTDHFPEAKESHLTLCNKRLAILFPPSASKHRGPNRRDRRSMKKNNRRRG